MSPQDPKAARKVAQVMHEFKHGELKSGRTGQPVKSRQQAVAIGLSEAREQGAKVPPPKAAKRSASRGKAADSRRQAGS